MKTEDLAKAITLGTEATGQLQKSHITAYTRHDGTAVQAHDDKRMPTNYRDAHDAACEASDHAWNGDHVSHEAEQAAHGNAVKHCRNASKQHMAAAKAADANDPNDHDTVRHHLERAGSMTQRAEQHEERAGTAKQPAKITHATIKKHPQYSQVDHNHLRNRGRTAEEIKTIWDREHEKGAHPVKHPMERDARTSSHEADRATATAQERGDEVSHGLAADAHQRAAAAHAQASRAQDSDSAKHVHNAEIERHYAASSEHVSAAHKIHFGRSQGEPMTDLQKAIAGCQEAADLLQKSHVSEYTRGNGTVVQAHEDNRHPLPFVDSFFKEHPNKADRKKHLEGTQKEHLHRALKYLEGHDDEKASHLRKLITAELDDRANRGA